MDGAGELPGRSGVHSEEERTDASTAELLERIRRGDPGAFEEAHGRYRSRLEAVAYRIVGNRADAEDVVQGVFQALPSAAYRGSASLWTYLYRAAVNTSVSAPSSMRSPSAIVPDSSTR